MQLQQRRYERTQRGVAVLPLFRWVVRERRENLNPKQTKRNCRHHHHGLSSELWSFAFSVRNKIALPSLSLGTINLKCTEMKLISEDYHPS